MAFAVAVTLATPDASVVLVVDERPALAPEAGTEKVTVAFGTTLPRASRTVTCKEVAKAVPIMVDWLAPDVAVMVPGCKFVRLNVAALAAPDTVTLAI